MNSKRVIIADENGDLREVLAFKFEHHGYTVVHADNVKDAFRVTLETPDQSTVAVIGDFLNKTDKMLSLVGNIRAVYDPEDLPILVISSHAFPHNEPEALAAGANIFMTRPFHRLDQVVEAVERLFQAA